LLLQQSLYVPIVCRRPMAAHRRTRDRGVAALISGRYLSVCNAGEISFSKEQRPAIRSIQIGFGLNPLQWKKQGLGRGRGFDMGSITVPDRSLQRQKKPSVTLVFCKLRPSFSLSRQRSRVFCSCRRPARRKDR
jgi:hypothetical protein